MHKVALDDGRETTLERWGENGPAILCIHGMTSSRRSWQRLAEHLASRYRIYAYDQRGHGDFANCSAPMTLARCTADAAAVARTIGEPIELLVGHSWGGAVALASAQQIAARNVLAIDPMLAQLPSQWYDEFIDDLTVQFSQHGEARDRSIREAYSSWHPVDVEGKVHAVSTMSVAPIAGLRDANPAKTWNLCERALAYPLPLLLALPDPEESIIPPDCYDRLLREAAPETVVARIPNGDHNLHRTAFEPFVAALDGWLEMRGLP
ncbi:MAG: alpha/beta hydrolase [Candidatus Eremiobacteraeota bacterium]|nr:alpha/beta hydrolase [Candidatus Eremiobacteraeota bacterium]NNM93077.1 alpha/beta hydrolase [Candidatus Eremiobacteraeota bacterium]